MEKPVSAGDRITLREFLFYMKNSDKYDQMSTAKVQGRVKNDYAAWRQHHKTEELYSWETG